MPQLELEEALPQLRTSLTRRQAGATAALLLSLSPEELVVTLDALDPSELGGLFTLLGDEAVADLVDRFEARDAARLLVRLGRAQAADVLEEMDPDDATDVVEALGEREAEAILAEMEPEEAAEVRQLLAYPPDSAGGIMSPDYVAVSPNLTVEQALAELRWRAEEAETLSYIYVVDGANRLRGVLSLRDLVLGRAGTPIAEITVSEVAKVRADADREDAAQLLTRLGLLAIPVVDDQERLVGIITADDVADVLVEEATEDIERLGGSEPLEAPYLRTSILEIARKRVVWLALLFVAGTITSDVLQHFEATLAHFVALTFFVPLLIGTGGNVGSQIVTTLVRAMAVGEVSLRHLVRVVGKELGIGLLLGLALATGAYIRALTLGVEPGVAGVVAMSAVFIVLWAALVAAALPLLIRRIGIDPALVSAPLITTLVDGTGLFLYLGTATLLLGTSS